MSDRTFRLVGTFRLKSEPDRNFQFRLLVPTDTFKLLFGRFEPFSELILKSSGKGSEEASEEGLDKVYLQNF